MIGLARLGVVLSMLASVAACVHTPKLPRPPPGVATRWAVVGERAPEIALWSLNGDERRLSDYSGRVVVVTFWTTFCGPCREELPAIEALRARYPDLVVLAVSLDEADDDDRVREVTRELHLHFPILRDPQGRVAFEYMKLVATPLTAIVGRDGRLRALHRGYLPPLAVRLNTEVQTALAEALAAKPGSDGP